MFWIEAFSFEFHHAVGSLVCSVTTKLSPHNTNSAIKKITRSEKSLGSKKSLVITNSLVYSDLLIARYHWKLKITSNHYGNHYLKSPRLKTNFHCFTGERKITF